MTGGIVRLLNKIITNHGTATIIKSGIIRSIVHVPMATAIAGGTAWIVPIFNTTVRTVKASVPFMNIMRAKMIIIDVFSTLQ